MATLHIIASCTDRKRWPTASLIRLHAVRPGAPLEDRATAWAAALATAPRRIAAEELYVGDHWAVARSLREEARGRRLHAELWIASAGYGLIHGSENVAGYSATFASGHRDAVCGSGAEERRAWWDLVCRLGPRACEVRSLRQLAAAYPQDRILVVGSASYISAMADDLAAARSKLLDPARLLIVSGRETKLPEPLSQNLLPSDARLQPVVGGALGSLHIRVARRIIATESVGDWDARKLRPRYEVLGATSVRQDVPERARSDDAAVRSFIQSELLRDDSLSASRLLRAYRDNGWACEQRRFIKLFEQVRMGGPNVR